MRALTISLVVSALACLPAKAAAQETPLDAYWYCYSQPDQDPIYVTPMWDARVAPDFVNTEFRKALASKYGYKGRVTCAGASKASTENTRARTEAGLQQRIAAWQKAGKKVVQVAWTSNEKPAGPPPANWSMCSAMIQSSDARGGQISYETFVSAAFDAGSATAEAQQAAFKAFLISKYGITTTDLNPYCQFTGDEATALSVIKARMAQGKGRGKVIETGWTFQK